MSPEWISAIVAIIAAFVAGGAAIVAYSQAISARRQADSSENAAKAASEQAMYARQSAIATERSSALEHLIELQAASRSLRFASAALDTLMEKAIVKDSLKATESASRELTEYANTLEFTTISVDDDFDAELEALVFDMQEMNGFLVEQACGFPNQMLDEGEISARVAPLLDRIDDLSEKLAPVIRDSRRAIQRN